MEAPLPYPLHRLLPPLSRESTGAVILKEDELLIRSFLQPAGQRGTGVRMDTGEAYRPALVQRTAVASNYLKWKVTSSVAW